MGTDQGFDPQEFTTATEAIEAILDYGRARLPAPDEVLARYYRACAWLTAGIDWARARGWSYTIEDCEPASPEEAVWRKAREDERLALVRYATEGVLADATRQATADAVRRDLVAAQKAAAGAGRRYKTACHALALAMNADRAQEAQP